MDQHTSGAQRAAEHEVTAEQRAELATRLRRRVDELAREASNLAIAATAHGSAETLVIAIGAREAADQLQRTGRSADHEVAVREREQARDAAR